MTNTKQTIEELYALDEKRTQGEWRIGAADALCVMKGSMRVADCRGHPGFASSTLAANAQFIAAAPTMMQVIRKQQELLAVAREALENIEGNSQCDANIAEKALKQLSEAIDD